MSIITRKIQLLISDYNKPEKLYSVVEKNTETYKNTWKELDKLDKNCYKIANRTTSKLIHNTNFLNEKFIPNKDGKRDDPYTIGKEIINDLNINFDGYSDVLNKTCSTSKDKLINDKKEILFGERSIPTFKKGMPIKFGNQKKRFVKQGYDYYITLFKLHFKLNFGRDRSNNKHIIEEINKGIYKFSDSSIQIKDGKIFLLLCVIIPQKQQKLDKNICLGVDLGMSNPACLALSSNSNYRKFLGNYNDYTKRRLNMQGIYKRHQQMNVGVNGKGRNKKMQRLEQYQNLEKNYSNTYEHRISKLIIDEAIKNNAGTIKMEDLKKFKKEFVNRNFGYFGYQRKIKQKAEQNGIDVVLVNPKYTSKTCHSCSNINYDLKLSDRKWICPQCKKELIRDWNAAYNIANSNNISEK